jgi:hypothetical protein
MIKNHLIDHYNSKGNSLEEIQCFLLVIHVERLTE